MKKFILMFIMALFAISTSFAAFGVSVENLETPMQGIDVFFPRMIRGGYAEKVIHLSNSDDIPAICKITITGDISEWISLEHGNQIIVPKNTDVKLKLIVHLPDDLPNGIYNGTIIAVAEPDSEDEGSYGLSIVSGVSLKTSIEVTGEQIYSFTAGTISVADTEVGLPVMVSVGIKNNGNVAVKPVIKAVISDNEGNEIVEAEHKKTAILASQSKDIIFSIDSEKLKEGQYWADISVYYENGTIVTNSKITFDVLEKGALRINGNLVHVTNKVWAKVGEVVKIDAVFENTGEIITTAKFSGEVYLGDSLVKTIESEQLSVAPGEQINLTTYFSPEKAGKYVVSGFVVYSEKITETKSSVINVTDGDAIPLGATIFLLIGMMVAVIFGFFAMRGRFVKFSKTGDSN